MNNLDEFKSFVRENPNLNSYVTNGTMTWQKFYEMYDMYGSDSPVWNDYKNKERKSPSISEIVELAKNVDVDKLQNGITSLQKAIGLFSDLIVSKDATSTTGYKPRAIYKRFDD